MLTIIFFGLGILFLAIGYLNVLNVREARKTGVISKSGHELGSSTYNREKSPFQYWGHYWGSMFAIIMCAVFGIGAIGLGIFLAFPNSLIN